MRDRALAAYQKALVVLLAEDLPEEERRTRLATESAFRPYAPYVGTIDGRCLDVGAELVRKWGIQRRSRC